SAGFARALLRATVTLRLSERGLRRLPAVADPAGIGEALAGAGAPDPAGRVTLDLPVESEDVAFATLAELGADAEVLAPEGLRARFRERARALTALYAADPTVPADPADPADTADPTDPADQR
ncbi:WYL domain-containing protein, partial [Streptomyces sp. SID12501]